MATVTVTDADRQRAETFLEEVLSDLNPVGDFSPGSFLRDLTITAMAHVVAYLRAENDLVLNRVALKRVLTMAPGDDRDEAADDGLSSWFLTRKDGRLSRGPLLVHVTTDTDVSIPLATRFFYDTQTIFTPDYDTDFFLPQEQLIKVADATGAVVDRYFSLNVVSSAVGDQYNVQPATWLNYDRFSPFISRVENLVQFVGGTGVETTDAFLARAPDAIAVRDLNSQRSLRATLLDKFADLVDVVVVGAGDPEMQRDTVSDVGTLSSVHTGGFTDVYLRAAPAPQIFQGAVGGSYVDPSPEVTILTDVNIANFVTSGVVVGSVLKINNPLSGEAGLYTISEVHPKYIRVSSRSPFPAVRSAVSYSIGNSYPNYTDLVAASTTGAYTNSFTPTGQVMLPADAPVYKITKVSYVDGAGTTHILARVDTTPGAGQYQLSYSRVSLAQTAYQIPLITVDPAVPDATILRVEYDSPAGFDVVHSYMADNFNRITCASVQAKALHPVYVSLPSVPYRLSATATTALDEKAAAQALADYLNALPATEILNVSDVVAFLRTTYPQLGAVAPFSINYTLFAPDGSQIQYTTTDAVTLDSTKETAVPARLTNPLAYGVSSRTVVFHTAASDITFTKQS